MILTAAAVTAGAEKVLVEQVYDGCALLTSDSQQTVLLGIGPQPISQPGRDICRAVLEKLVRGSQPRLEAGAAGGNEQARLMTVCGPEQIVVQEPEE
jgi:hypothetical protein